MASPLLATSPGPWGSSDRYQLPLALEAASGLASSNGGTTPSPPNKDENELPEYLTAVLVPVFFSIGLVGVFICHLLKKKGYRCTTEAEQDSDEKVGKIELAKIRMEDGDAAAQMEEADADVLKAVVVENSVCDTESSLTPSTAESLPVSSDPWSPRSSPEKHTCGRTAEGAVCRRCRHKWKRFKKPGKKPKGRRSRRQGEVTVFSVGRLRVTKVESAVKVKEQRSLKSVSDADSVSSEAPATPAKKEESGTE